MLLVCYNTLLTGKKMDYNIKDEIERLKKIADQQGKSNYTQCKVELYEIHIHQAKWDRIIHNVPNLSALLYGELADLPSIMNHICANIRDLMDCLLCIVIPVGDNDLLLCKDQVIAIENFHKTTFPNLIKIRNAYVLTENVTKKFNKFTFDLWGAVYELELIYTMYDDVPILDRVLDIILSALVRFCSVEYGTSYNDNINAYTKLRTIRANAGSEKKGYKQSL